MDSDLARLAVQLSDLRQRLLDDGSEDAARLVAQAFKLVRKARASLVETGWGEVAATAYAPAEAEPDYSEVQQAPKKARRAARRQGKVAPREDLILQDDDAYTEEIPSVASLADRWVRQVRREVASRGGLDGPLVLRIVEQAQAEARHSIPEPDRKATERWLIRIASRIASRYTREHREPSTTNDPAAGTRILRDAVQEMRRSAAS